MIKAVLILTACAAIVAAAVITLNNVLPGSGTVSLGIIFISLCKKPTQ